MHYNFRQYLFLLFFVSGVISCTTNEILIGTMLAPAQGATAAQLSYVAAVELAVADFRQQLSQQGTDVAIRLVKGDLGANPDIALANFKSLVLQGVTLFVGPSESSNLISLMDSANTNGAIVISNASTSPTLSIPNDNIYRLVPDDVKQTQKLASRIYADGFTGILVIGRSDLYGDDFRRHLELAFEALNPTNFVIDEIYLPTSTDYTQQVQAWLEDIQAGPINPTNTALVLISFEEIVPIVTEMIVQNAPVFGSFRWYSGDGVAQISDVIDNVSVGTFLRGVNLLATSPTVATTDNANLQAFYGRLNETFPGAKSIFAATAYDATTLLLKTQLRLRENGTSGVPAFKTELPIVASVTNGVTGNLTLNAAGDRNFLPYALWGITQAGALNWTIVTANLP